MFANTTRKVLRAAGVGVLVMLAGCASPATRTIDSTKSAAADAQKRYDDQAATIGPDQRPVARIHNTQWVDINPVQRSRADDVKDPPCHVDLSPPHSLSIEKFQQLMAVGGCHLDVRFTADALSHIHGGTSDQGDGTKLPPNPSGGPTALYAGPSGAVDPTITLNYSGDVDGALQNVAMQLDLSERRTGNQVEFFYTETKLFRINLQNSSTTITTDIQTGIQSSSGQGGAGQSASNTQSGTRQGTEIRSETDPAKDFASMVGKIVPSSAYTYSVATGQLVVTSTPDKLAAVQQLVNQFNDIVTKQVKVKLVVGMLTLTKDDSIGLDAGIKFAGKHGIGLGLANSFPVTSGASAGNVSILDTASGKLAQFAGTTLTLNALRQIGSVQVVQEQVLYTLNLHPAPYQDGQQTTYLAESGATVTSGGQATGFAQSSLVPGVVSTGFNVVSRPFVFDDGKTMSLDFKMNLSALDELTPIIGQDGAMIQGPKISNNLIDQTVRIRSGQTMLITGIRNHNSKANKSGTVNASFWGLGGGLNNDDSRKVGFVIVTPVVE
jgi:type IVB pilus formation R64 PilN family outer membrane protein